MKTLVRCTFGTVLALTLLAASASAAGYASGHSSAYGSAAGYWSKGKSTQRFQAAKKHKTSGMQTMNYGDGYGSGYNSGYGYDSGYDYQSGYGDGYSQSYGGDYGFGSGYGYGYEFRPRWDGTLLNRIREWPRRTCREVVSASGGLDRALFAAA